MKLALLSSIYAINAQVTASLFNINLLNQSFSSVSLREQQNVKCKVVFPEH